MQFCITGQELRAALADIEEAERNGFCHSLAVFNLSSCGRMLCENLASHDPGDVWAKAHPTDGTMDWGRQGAHKRCRFVNGELESL